MQKENKNAKYVVYNDKKIPLSSLTFQTRQIMQRQSELQQEVTKLQMAINENQLLVTQYSNFGIVGLRVRAATNGVYVKR